MNKDRKVMLIIALLLNLIMPTIFLLLTIWFFISSVSSEMMLLPLLTLVPTICYLPLIAYNIKIFRDDSPHLIFGILVIIVGNFIAGILILIMPSTTRGGTAPEQSVPLEELELEVDLD
ncbi:hypothetical protein SCLARK_001850 [Spiroplasma clarkii]|uniref:Uncharacterized protein n=1 Tax=Spiroplasma clarkii TaxID=2139 RepID=A0A1Y0L3M9_9MOLU|nr:hypothetical protein [Spiroplasma clarkii]ARU92289.1 hypothetical protein SCLARK_001850 [Spiroplasma clarkii]ATX71597.1 hypothetical protein SCLAR_v1c12990 [Spiroplasma clarkii]